MWAPMKQLADSTDKINKNCQIYLLINLYSDKLLITMDNFFAKKGININRNHQPSSQTMHQQVLNPNRSLHPNQCSTQNFAASQTTNATFSGTASSHSFLNRSGAYVPMTPNPAHFQQSNYNISQNYLNPTLIESHKINIHETSR